MAPELVERRSYDSKVDVWALGVLTYMILVGKEPFKGYSQDDLFRQIKQGSPDYERMRDFHAGGKLITDFLESCLQKDPSKRATAESLLGHEWIKTMVKEESVDKEQRIEIALNIYNFKKATILQSSVIALLCRLKSAPEEHPLLRKYFLQLNTSNTGRLTAAELRAGTKHFKGEFNRELGKSRKYEANWDKLVHCIDVDKDGTLGFDEFVTAATDRHRLLNDPGNLTAVFEILDKDKDNFISIADMKEQFSHGSLGQSEEKIQPMQAKEWEDLLKGIDRDGDGKISFAEFEEHMLEMLKKEPNFSYGCSTATVSTALTAGSGPGNPTYSSSALSSQLTGFTGFRSNNTQSTTKSSEKRKARFEKKSRSGFRVRVKPPTARGFEEPDMVHDANSVREIFHKNPEFWAKM